MARRSLLDRLALVLALLFVLFTVGRALSGVGSFALAFARESANGPDVVPVGRVELRKSLRAAWSEARNSREFLTWWSGRRRPWATGGDYAATLANRPLDRTLGCLLGAIVEREQRSGVRFEKLIMPEDSPQAIAELTGAVNAASFERADGKKVVRRLVHPAADFTWVSGVPTSLQAYDFMLEDSQLRAIKAGGEVTRVVRGVSIVSPPEQYSGIWVLTSRVTSSTPTNREFLLVPAELVKLGEG